MDERHQPRGKSIIGTGMIIFGLCVAALFVPQSVVDRLGSLFGKTARVDAFSDDVARLDADLEGGEATAVQPQQVALIAARRLTRAGPMTAEEMTVAAELWDAQADDDTIVARFPRLDPARVRSELAQLRAQLQSAPPGAGPTQTCGTCHRETLGLPAGRRYDVRGIYPFAADAPELAGGRRVPVLSESIEVDAFVEQTGEEQTCQTCHAAHGEPGFEVGRDERVRNMGLWVNVRPSDANVLQLEVKVRNTKSAHRAPAGRLSPAYAVTVEARQHREPLALRFGQRLPPVLRSEERNAGAVFGRDFRDADGRATSDPAKIADLVADTRLESGRFQQLNFLFDRRDTSIAYLDVVLWYLPDATTWLGAVPIRRASKPERAH